MKKSLLPFAIGVLMGMFILQVDRALAEPAADVEADIAAIQAVISRYAAAVEAADAEQYLSCWDDDGVQMPPDAPAVFGKEKIGANVSANFQQRLAAGTHVDMNIPIPEEVQVLGDYAFTRGTYTVSVTTPDGDPLAFVDGKVLSIWRRQADAEWKLYIDTFNSNVPPGSTDPTSLDALSWGAVKAQVQR